MGISKHHKDWTSKQNRTRHVGRLILGPSWQFDNVKNRKIHNNKGSKKCLNLIFNKKQNKIMQFKKQKHEMCKTNVKTDLQYANICKHEYEKNMTKL